MRESFPEAIVEAPEEIIQAVSNLPDSNDCHVLAAAIFGKANVIVTQNTKHFPPALLEQYGLLSQNVDDFLIHQYHLGPGEVLEKLDEQAANIKKERCYLLKLLGVAAPRFVSLLLSEKIG